MPKIDGQYSNGYACQSSQSNMSASDSNVFSRVYNVIRAFDDLNFLNETDALTGKFKLVRKTNKRMDTLGYSKVKATFLFDDDIVSGLNFKKVKFEDKGSKSLSLFGDAHNRRKNKSGNTKLDYLAGPSFDDASQKLVELSVERKYIQDFDSGRKVKGFFRASLDDNFIAMSKGQSDSFSERKIMTADFEIPFL